MSQETISNERNTLNNSNFQSNSYHAPVHNHIYSKNDQQQQNEISFKPIERKGLQNNHFSNNAKLTLTRPIGLPPNTPVTQKSADQR